MGIGYPDKTKNRRIEQDSDFVFPSFKKEIKVEYIE